MKSVCLEKSAISTHSQSTSVGVQHHQQEEWPMLRFHPLNAHCQQRFCQQLGLEYCRANYFGQGGPDHILRHPNRSDGNCLFRAFSLIITGSQSQHMAVRCSILSHMCTIPHFVLRSHLSTYHTIEDYISPQRMDEEHTWGSDIEILTFAKNKYLFIQYNS